MSLTGTKFFSICPLSPSAPTSPEPPLALCLSLFSTSHSRRAEGQVADPGSVRCRYGFCVKSDLQRACWKVFYSWPPNQLFRRKEGKPVPISRDCYSLFAFLFPFPSLSSPSSTKKSLPQLQDKEIIILSCIRLFHGDVTKARSLV